MKINATPPYNPIMGLNKIPRKRTCYLADCFKDIVTDNLFYNQGTGKLGYMEK